MYKQEYRCKMTWNYINTMRETVLKKEDKTLHNKQEKKGSPNVSHTQTEGNLIYFGDYRCLSRSEESKCMCLLIEKGICDCQNISSFLVFVFLCTFIRTSLHFSVRVFLFFSNLLCFLYFGTFLSTWSQDNTWIINTIYVGNTCWKTKVQSYSIITRQWYSWPIAQGAL